MAISKRNGVDIYYERAGTGPAMVFVHAIPFDHNLWIYQRARFSDRFTTIAMDLRGWGRSGKPREAFSLREMGDDVMGVLADEGIAGGAVIVGCSVGSKISLMLACDHPDVFKAVILVGGHSGPQHQFAHRIAGYATHAADGTLADYQLGHLRHGVTRRWADTPIGRYLLSGFVERARDLDAECIAQVFNALTVSDLTAKLSTFATPTLIVNGEHDGALEGGKRTASLIKQAEHRILADAGHCCFIERPRSFDALVIDFLERNDLMP